MKDKTPGSRVQAVADTRPMGARIVANVFSGVIAGAFVISFTISLAALIFSGGLSRYLPAGIGILLVSSFLIGTIVSLGSAFKPVTAAAQDNTGVILAIIAAEIQRRAAPSADILPTLIVAIATTSLATGVVFYLLGRFRLGKIVRFMPYPVVGGFLAGTGWLLVQGSLTVMSGFSVGLHDLGKLTEPDVLVRWLPGVGFGLVLAFVLRRFKHYLVLPGLLVGAFVAFFLTLKLTGLGLDGAGQKGLLLGPFPQGGLWPPVGLGALSHVDASFFRDSAGNMGACVLLAVIAALLNASGLELATDQEVDHDRELRVHGVANLITGLVGGAPGYVMLSGSMLSYRAGARSRVAGVLAASACLLPLIAGTGVLGYFPKAVLGGLLFFLGFSFLLENVFDSFFRLPRGEYALVLFILTVVVTAGFLQGVGVGIVVSSFLFAINYARIDVVRHAISGAQLRSKAGRSATDESILRRAGAQTHVVQLQGYVFFGTAHNLLSRVKERVTQAEAAKVRFVLLDFRHVHGLDASAVVSFTRMKRLAETHGVTLLFTELPDSVRAQLERGGCLEASGGVIRVFGDLDRGLQFCEDELLLATEDRPPTSEALRSELSSVVRDPRLVTRLLAYLERVEAEKGFDLFLAGDEATELFLVESGEVEAWLKLAGGRERRLRSMGPGTVVGESALYLGGRRSASVRTTQPSVLYRLSGAALERMTSEAPELAAAFHRFVAAMLADRMVSTTSAAQMLFH